MEFGAVTTSQDSLQAYLDSVSFDAWKKLDGDAAAISICNITSSTPLIFKGEHMTRLAYPISTTYMRRGKVRATFAVSSKTAAAMVKLESALKDRIGSSGMMKKTEIKQTYQSCVHGPTAKYPSHTLQLEMRVETPKTSLYAQVPKSSGSGWDTDPVDYDAIQKFSLMSIRVAPTLLWKGNGKCAIKFQVKQGIVAHEEEIPAPVDEVREKKTPYGILRYTIRIPSPQEIAMHRGFSRETLAKWGVSWPPEQGWRSNLEGRWVGLSLDHPAYFQAHIDVQWDDLDNDEFMSDLATAGSAFSAEKLVPKGMKTVKGAVKEVSMDDEPPASAKTKIAEKKPAGKKKASPTESNDAEEEDDEEIIAFGLGSSPPPNVKKPVPKRPKKSVKTMDLSDIPAPKINLPSASDVLDQAMDEMEEELEEP